MCSVASFPCLHYTSAFVRKGKVRPLKTLKNQPDYQKTFIERGMSSTVSNTTKEALQRFTATMYVAEDSENTRLNKWRYEKFMKTYGPKGNGEDHLANLKGTDASGLPPCEDELILTLCVTPLLPICGQELIELIENITLKKTAGSCLIAITNRFGYKGNNSLNTLSQRQKN